MNGNVIVANETLYGIAEAIRSKSSTTDEMTVQEMATRIAEIPLSKDEQTKTETMTTLSSVTVTPDEGKTLSSVTVNPPSEAVIPSGNTDITSTASFDVKSSATAQVVDANLVAANIKKDVEILGVTGTLESGGGKQEQDKTETMVGLVAKTVTPDEGYTLSSATVNPPSDDNLVAENIKKDVTIFDVTGTLESGGVDERVNAIVSRTIENLEGDDITSVGGEAFIDCPSLTTVSLPNATSVGDDAFGYCTALTTVSLPNATRIGYHAFGYCEALTTVSLPNATSIGEYAFGYCTSLTTVSLPSATSIGESAFRGCTSLTTVSLPNATSIGYYAFCGCTALTTVSLQNATSIGNYAFEGCTALTTIDLSSISYDDVVANVFKWRIAPASGVTCVITCKDGETYEVVGS